MESVICKLIHCISEWRVREKDLVSDVILLPEDMTNSQALDLRSSTLLLMSSLQSFRCYPSLAVPLPPCMFPLYIWELNCVLQFSTAPVAYQRVGVVEIQYPLVCVIVPESTLLFKNTICY